VAADAELKKDCAGAWARVASANRTLAGFGRLSYLLERGDALMRLAAERAKDHAARLQVLGNGAAKIDLALIGVRLPGLDGRATLNAASRPAAQPPCSTNEVRSGWRGGKDDTLFCSITTSLRVAQAAAPLALCWPTCPAACRLAGQRQGERQGSQRHGACPCCPGLGSAALHDTSALRPLPRFGPASAGLLNR
jgi:hypothetical protein